MKTNKRRNHMISLICSAVLFGGISSSTAYAVNELLSNKTTEVALATVETVDTVSTVNTSTESGYTVADIAAAGLPSVVSVTNISVQEVQNYFGHMGRGGIQTQLQQTTSSGSGVIIYQDTESLYMITNYHVIEDATELSITFVDDTTVAATVVGYEEDLDIAVVKVSLQDLPESTLEEIAIAIVGNSDSLIVGEQVVAIGNALGYGQSVTTGIVSAVDRSISDTTGTYIQTDAAINPGNSGGALFNMNGELVGINTAKISTTDVEGMGYAIPMSQIITLIEDMIAG